VTDEASPRRRPRLAPADVPRLLPTATARAAAVVLALVTVVHLAAQAVDDDVAARVTQVALMPLLAAALWCATSAPRPRLVRLALVALGCAWLGDTLPAFFAGDAAFLVMVGGFLAAQLVYAAAFWPWRARSLARRPWALAAYAGLAAALVGLCAPGAGGVLLAAVVVYAACLVTMAILATGVHPFAGAGGAVFLASDAMIALGAFTPWFPTDGAGFWVMLTYVAAQCLLVAGVLARCIHSAVPSSASNPSRS
jgi:hypothetical membrane protein